MEIWKDIKWFNGLYMISSYGRVAALKRTVWNGKGYYSKSPRIMKVSFTTTGYHMITLTDRYRKRHIKKVHHLVLNAFTGKRPVNKNERIVTNHKDGNPTNNNIENLEWCTQKYNCRHAIEIGLRHVFYIGKKDLGKDYSLNMLTAEEIAIKYETTKSIIMRSLIKYDIDRRAVGSWNNKYNLDRDTIFRQVKIEKMSQLEIAKKAGCTQSNISHYITKLKNKGEWE